MKFRLKDRVGKVHIRLDGKTRSVIRAGQVIDVNPKQITHLKEKFEPLDKIETAAPDTAPKVELQIVLRPNTTAWFDVVNPETGKAINSKALKKADAENLAGHPYVEHRPEPSSDPGGDSGINHGNGDDNAEA